MPAWMRDLARVGLPMAALALALYVTGIGCPIKFVTGVSCPGCGMTRAWLSVLRLRPLEAVAYHPLFWVLPVAVALALAERSHPRGWVRVVMIALAGALLALWAIRLALPNDARMLVSTEVTGDIVSISAPAWFPFRSMVVSGAA